jgi:hypothetical protein
VLYDFENVAEAGTRSPLPTTTGRALFTALRSDLLCDNAEVLLVVGAYTTVVELLTLMLEESLLADVENL